MNSAELPPLPEPIELWLPSHVMEYFTADQMREYALAVRNATPALVVHPNPLATGPTEWRANHCVTHHFACDCREWEHACMVEALQSRLDRVVALAVEVLKRDGDTACKCIHISRKAEREYESGTCPHQRLRAALASGDSREVV